MKALVITKPGGPEVLEIVDRPAPVPIGDQILVRVRAAGLNRADLMQRAGNYPAPAGVPADIPGLEYAGSIEAVGPDVRTLAPGGRVMGLVGGGAQAEFVITREALAIPIPDSLTDPEAGGIPEAYITAHDALVTQGSLGDGECVLVHAVGSGVGVAAMQIAKSRGCTVFGTSRSPEKLKKAAALGLDRAIDTAAESFDAVIESETRGRGVDVVIDFVGEPYFARNLLALGMCGRLVVVSTLGGATVNISLRTLMVKRLRVVGTMLRSRSYEEKVEATRAFARDVLPIFTAGNFKVPVDRTFPLSEATAAHAYLAENQNFGKVVFQL